MKYQKTSAFSFNGARCPYYVFFCLLNSSYQVGFLPSFSCKGLINLIFKKGHRLDVKAGVQSPLWMRTASCVLYPSCSSFASHSFCGPFWSDMRHSGTLFWWKCLSFTRQGRFVLWTSHSGCLPFSRPKEIFWSSWMEFFVCYPWKDGFSFIGRVHLFYSKARRSIFVHGYTSPVFYPTRGVRQGCPLSPLLYVSTMEVYQ